MKYLWDDALRMNQEDVFNCRTFDELKNTFLKDGFEVFKIEAISNLQKIKNITTQDVSIDPNNDPNIII